ncbi:MAG: sigma-54-dependent Fis family transcriptional regulator [Acidimicrobiia bacterium]|nr:sigma-54-dependent Fis family transcriptional regulator [Acidimicrobiia bacterium]
MGLSYDAALNLFRSGEVCELLRQSESSPQDIAKIPRPEHRLLLARCLFYVGRVEDAASVATATHCSNPATESRAEVTLGLVAKRRGDFDLALKHLQHAVHLARSSQDIQQEGWARLHLFRLLLEVERFETLAPMLREIKQCAVQAADPHLNVYLHDAVAVMEGQVGSLEQARRHVAMGRSVLERYPNALLGEMIEVTASCLASLELDFQSAKIHERKARVFGAVTSHVFCSLVLEVNEAHRYLVSGKLMSAREALLAMQRSPAASVRAAAIDGLARLYVATGHDDLCAAVLETAEQAIRHPKTGAMYSLRWLGLSHAKLTLRQGRLDTLDAHLDHELQRAEALHDAPLLAALRLLRAEGASMRGHGEQVGRELLLAADLGVTTNPELQGHYHLTCSRVLERTGSALAPLFRARAERVWRERRNLLALIEAGAWDGPPIEIADYDQDPRFAGPPARTPVSVPVQTAPAAVLSAVANVFDLTAMPSELGAELQQIIATLGCAPFARVQTGRAPAAAPDEFTVPLGEDGGRALALTYRAAPDPGTTVLVSALARIARAALAVERMRRDENERAAVWPAAAAADGDPVYVDEQMVSLVAAARRVAGVNVSVLVTGETGTGKEVLARLIHSASPRSRGTFLPFNCAACPRDIIDAQLFGHRRGAFTGAMESAPGVIRAAAGGTLFLDEIGEAPLDIQPKLLRFLESGEVHPLGEAHPVKADVRVIAATNVDLDALVSAGRFREDLFYRLNIVRLHLPPLRERRVEIATLAERYLSTYAREFHKGDLRLAEETMEYLLLYRWPGNVRQLANEMRRLAAMAESGAVLMPEHLSPDIARSRRTVPPSERPLSANEVVVRTDQPLPAAVEHLERAMVTRALQASDGRVEDAARRLGLSRKGLYLKRVRFGLEIGEQEARSA